MLAQVDGEWVSVNLSTGFRADSDGIVLEPKDVRLLMALNKQDRAGWLRQLLTRFPSERHRHGYLPGAFGPEPGVYLEQSSEDELRAVLGTLLDAVDYENGACRLTETIGGVLPKEVLSLAREALLRSVK